MQQGDRLRSRRETSEFLGVPEKTLAQWAYLGRGPRFYRVGKHARYDEADVRDWLEAQAKEPAGSP